MGSWKGRVNQYIQFVRVLYCKLPTNGKQLPAFPLETVRGSSLASGVEGESVTTLPPWPLICNIENLNGHTYAEKHKDYRVMYCAVFGNMHCDPLKLVHHILFAEITNIVMLSFQGG